MVVLNLLGAGWREGECSEGQREDGGGENEWSEFKYLGCLDISALAHT